MRTRWVAPALVLAAIGGAAAADTRYFPAEDVTAAFATGAVLFDGVGTNYMVHASRRETAGQAEVHARDTDVIYVLEGSAVLVTGGDVVAGAATAADEIRGAAIEGGETRRVAKGDVVILRGDGTRIELPVKLRVHDSIFVPLAKWAMLLAGNYRCVTKDGMRTAQEAVHSDLATAKSVYDFVFDLCVKLGANPADLVPYEKYAAAAQSLVRPASAARALQNGAPNIERADKLVQLIAKQKGLSHPAIDAQVALVDRRIEANRKKAAAA